MLGLIVLLLEGTQSEQETAYDLFTANLITADTTPPLAALRHASTAAATLARVDSAYRLPAVRPTSSSRVAFSRMA